MNLIEELKQTYSYDQNLVNLFNIQQMIILFNLGDNESLSLIIKQLNVKALRKRSKMDYYLVVGHIRYLEGNYSASFNYLKKCESYLINKNFHLDLSFLYNDLTIITGETCHAQKSMYHLELHNKNPKYNVFQKEP